jgi:1-acyl-sn-glycerol-3-phosphate acyltransferase
MRRAKTAVCFIVFGLGSLAITLAVLPFLWLFVWNGDARRLRAIRCVRLAWRILRWIMEGFRLIDVHVSAEDARTLGTLSSTIIASNHPTLIDIVLLGSLTKDATCIASGRLYKNPIMRFVLANAFVSNDGDPEAMISRSAAALRKGLNLIVFPHGTRNEGGGKLRRGTAHIAWESQAEILVAKISSTPTVLRKGKGWHDVADRTSVFRIELQAALAPADIGDAAKSRNINARAITAKIEDALDILKQ